MQKRLSFSTMSLSILTLAMMVLASASAIAGEHNPGSIIGPKMELFERDHAFAGEILDRPVFGSFEHAPAGASVQIRVNEQTVKLQLAQSGNTYGGSISEKRVHPGTGKARLISTSIRFVKAEKTGERSARLVLAIDGQESIVDVTAPVFQNNHFHAPTFHARLSGRLISFQFTGESCMGYSTNLAMMILGSYAHLLK